MNTNKEKILLFWSGGKNSALALHHLINSNFEVMGLVTILNRDTNRVSFRGAPDVLILEQAKLLKLPLQRIFVPGDSSEEQQIEQVSNLLKIFAKKNITNVAFGDSCLEHERLVKEKICERAGMKANFPLWGKSASELNSMFFETNHKAIVTAIHKEMLNANFLAFEYSPEYVSKLPEGTSASGENNEFHTFVTFGPTFKMRVPFSKAIAVDEGPYLVSLLKEP
jgi:uncharacterized protein (TIGR00290 family)